MLVRTLAAVVLFPERQVIIRGIVSEPVIARIESRWRYGYDIPALFGVKNSSLRQPITGRCGVGIRFAVDTKLKCAGRLVDQEGQIQHRRLLSELRRVTVLDQEQIAVAAVARAKFLR